MSNTNLWQIGAAGFPARSFASLGLCKPMITKASMDTDTATFRADGTALDAGFLWPWGTFCTITKGGKSWFQGTLTKPVPQGTGKSESIEYELSGPWWDLTQCVYQQQSNFYNNNPTSPAATLSLTPLLTLGYEYGNSAFNRITTGRQIESILTYAISCGARLQIGEVDTGILFPVSEEKAQVCSNLIHTVMQWVPDQVFTFDYSTSPPTANVVRRSNAKTVTFSIQGPPADGVKLVPRNDLQVPVVGLYYVYGSNAGGSNWSTQSSDIYPPGGNVRQLRALVAPLELAGGDVQTQKQPVVTKPIPPDDNGDNGRDVVAWFQRKCAQLQGLTTANLSVVPNTYGSSMSTPQYDINGNLLVMDANQLPNELVAGSIPPWMVKPASTSGTTQTGDGYLHAATVTVSAQLQYNFSATGISDEELTQAKQLYDPSQQGEGTDYGWVYVNVMATDAITQVYEKPISETTQEQPPAGMAEYVYSALAQLHQEGEFPIKEQECGGAIQVGNALNLTGGRSEWATMQAQVQRVVEDIGSGTTTATVGPAKHLSPVDLLELLRSWRSVRMTKQLEARQTGTNDNTLGGSDGIGQTPHSSSAIQPAPTPASSAPWAPVDATDSGGTKCKIGDGTILKSRAVNDMLTVTGLNTAQTISIGQMLWIDVSITDNSNGTISLGAAELQSGSPDWNPDPIEVNPSGFSGPIQSDYNILIAEVVPLDDERDGVVCGTGASALKVIPLCRENQLMRLDTPYDGAGAGLLCWVAQDYTGAVA